MFKRNKVNHKLKSFYSILFSFFFLFLNSFSGLLSQ